jgi:glycosyltransferase involved in cell wall biosynthesis
MTPRVSVVLVTYNRAELLALAIEDLLAQTYRDFELLICDDESTDDTRAVAEAAAGRDPRVRYLRRTVNLGMPANLNAGVEEAAGELVANLHDSDRFAPTLLEKWVDALDACPDAAFVFNAYGWTGTRGEVRRTYAVDVPPCAPGSVLLERVFFRRWRFNSPVWGTVMVRRAAYDQMLPFDPRFGIVADVDMWLRMAERWHVAYVPERLIELPARDVVPHLFTAAEQRQSQTHLERMFWEARARHFGGRRGRLALEALRHGAFVPMARAATVLQGARRRWWALRKRP